MDANMMRLLFCYSEKNPIKTTIFSSSVVKESLRG